MLQYHPRCLRAIAFIRVKVEPSSAEALAKTSFWVRRRTYQRVHFTRRCTCLLADARRNLGQGRDLPPSAS